MVQAREILLVSLLIQASIGDPVFNRDIPGGGKIIGGVEAKLGEIPYIISLKHRGSHTCGGSILDETHVLTAAHCVYGRESDPFEVQYGVIDSTSPDNRINVTKIRIHEGFNPNLGTANDVAVLTIAEKMVFGTNAQPTVLPSTPLIVVQESIESRLSGWGFTATEGVQRYLLTTTFPLFNDITCLSLLEGFNPLYHTCAGSVDGTHKQCSGDSGGPLYANEAQQGIVSWSVKPCTSQNKPGVFTRVANYVPWIQRTMRD